MVKGNEKERKRKLTSTLLEYRYGTPTAPMHNEYGAGAGTERPKVVYAAAGHPAVQRPTNISAAKWTTNAGIRCCTHFLRHHKIPRTPAFANAPQGKLEN